MLVKIKIINAKRVWVVRRKKKSFFDILWCRFAVYPSLDVFPPHTEKNTKNQKNPKKKKH